MQEIARREEPAVRRQAAVRHDLRRYLQTASIFVALALLWVVLSFSSPYFFTTNNILNILLQSSVVGILAAGFTLVLISGEIDLSFTSVSALAGVVAAVIIVQDGIPVLPGILLVLGVGVAAGLVNAYMTMIAGIPSFIVTLAMLGIAQGLAFVLTGAQTIQGFPSAYTELGQGKVGRIPVPVFFLIGVYVVLHYVLSRRPFGVDVYAVGGSRKAATLAGLRPGRVVTIAFVTSGALAALAGIILSAQLDAGQGNFGQTNLLDAIAAVVIGGASLNGGSGTFVGTAAGVLMIATINNGLVILGVSPFWVQVVVGLIILAAVMTDRLAKGELDPRQLVPLPRRGS
jgi:ribose/xylose/arabinose/galactoside ABC-type transport system permease subunit